VGLYAIVPAATVQARLVNKSGRFPEDVLAVFIHGNDADVGYSTPARRQKRPA